MSNCYSHHSGWRCIKQELEFEHSSKQQTLNGDSHGTTNSNSNGSAVNGVQSGAVASKIKYISGCTTSSIPSTFYSYTLILTAYSYIICCAFAENFVPFDLESFWGQRIYQNLLQSS